MSLRGRWWGRAMRVDRCQRVRQLQFDGADERGYTKGLGAGDVLSIQISENPDTQNL